MAHVSQLQCSQCRSCTQKECFRQPWASWKCWDSSGRGRHGGVVHFVTTEVVSASVVSPRCFLSPARGTDHKGLSQRGCCKQPVGHRNSSTDQFAAEQVALPKQVSAFPTLSGGDCEMIQARVSGEAGTDSQVALNHQGFMSLPNYLSAGSFTKPAKQASWTRLSPYTSYWDGWVETS